MFKLIVMLTLAIAFACPTALAQTEKKKAAEATPAADKKSAADAKKPDRPMPMNSRADEINAAGKSWTQVNKDGKRVKHVVTAETPILQSGTAAKFEDIKAGDTVAGLRKKVSDTEYTVVKITKFGPKPAKSADKKSAEDSKKKE